ncbi:MAG: non-heme Fe2+,alpha-ketoglutarate-dependent halogenase [Saprospiraceae bacterium]|jgi:non-heme Fe2+,alpha-ketoglutarate-dependent halogenase
MGKVLTTNQIEQYHEEGFASPIDVLTEVHALEYATKLEEAEHKYPEALHAENRNNAHLCFSFLDELAFHPTVLDAVEDLIGSHFALWGSVLFIKEPQSKHYVSWHQDATYMGIKPHNFVTPWIALSPSNQHTGCMSMIPGSHLDAIQPHQDTFSDDNILTRGQQVENVNGDSAIDLILAPGQMSLHHATIIHGSQPNLSTHRRIGFALQAFMPAGAIQTIGDNYWQKARGNDNESSYQYLDRPHADMDAGNVTSRENVNQNWANILYQGASRKRAY